MQEQHGYAIRIAAFFPVDAMQGIGFEKAVLAGQYFRKQIGLDRHGRLKRAEVTLSPGKDGLANAGG